MNDSATSPALTVFGADWCPDCRRFAPTFTALSRQYADRLRFYRVSTSRCPDLEALYKVGLIPTVLLFLDGQVVRTWEFIEDPAAYRSVFGELPAAPEDSDDASGEVAG